MTRTSSLLASAIPAALAGAALLVLPAPCAAQGGAPRDPRLTLAGHFALGLGGDAVFDVHDTTLGDVSTSLDPTVGFGARADYGVLDVLAIGALFQALAFNRDVRDAGSDWTFDFAGYVRLRWAIEVAEGTFLEPYALFPLGFGFVMGDDLDRGSGDEPWPGFYTGALAGVSLMTSAHVGGFVELGWEHHEFWTSARAPIVGNYDVTVYANQFALHLGASVEL